MSQARERTSTPMQPSNEATAEQLALAKEQGDALKGALKAMFKIDEHSQEQQSGDYLVACVVEEAEGLYYWNNGKLEWHAPQDENVHIEVSVRDGADGRLLPGLTVQATVIDTQGKQIGSHALPFLWHPWLYHYGCNCRVPGDGKYNIRVHVEAPHFPRHDKINGKRYLDAVDVEFKAIQVKTGQKKS